MSDAIHHADLFPDSGLYSASRPFRNAANACPVFQSQPPRQPKYCKHRANVQQNRSQVPSPGPQSEQCVIQHRPRHEQWPVIHLVSCHVVPQIAPERAWQIAPRPDDRTVHNLRPVIPYEIERQRAAVNHKGDQPQQGQHDARPAQVLCQQFRCARFRLPLCLHVHGVRGERVVRSRSAHTNLPFPPGACYSGYLGVPLIPAFRPLVYATIIPWGLSPEPNPPGGRPRYCASISMAP